MNDKQINGYMRMALETSQYSKDPNTKVGAIVVDSTGCTIYAGWNTMPVGFDDTYTDSLASWQRDSKNPLNTKYPFVIHAELACLYNLRKRDIEFGSIFVTHFPCNECAKIISLMGIINVYYIHEYQKDQTSYLAALHILRKAHIRVYKLEERGLYDFEVYRKNLDNM